MNIFRICLWGKFLKTISTTIIYIFINSWKGIWKCHFQTDHHFFVTTVISVTFFIPLFSCFFTPIMVGSPSYIFFGKFLEFDLWPKFSRACFWNLLNKFYSQTIFWICPWANFWNYFFKTFSEFALGAKIHPGMFLKFILRQFALRQTFETIFLNIFRICLWGKGANLNFKRSPI